MKKLLALLLLSPIAYSQDVMNLNCIDKENDSTKISVIIDLTNKKFITQNQTFDLLVTESTYVGKDDSDLRNVIYFTLNRITLSLSYQELNLSLGGNVKRITGVNDYFEKSYSCSVVSKI